eukprot:TRINITY_DN64985_c0_g1_i4.p1 TRINITY_DN64985_c0_g1~~TRINITY_DN64985_c0_g1_i4.p1  ORF type:complete len:380 (-),score=39.26 TRINITY_DN64985_c0_g1_i4:234-1352(-)
MIAIACSRTEDGQAAYHHACAADFEMVAGDAVGGTYRSVSCSSCASLCRKSASCLSYECKRDPDDYGCYLNTNTPTLGPHKDYFLCVYKERNLVIKEARYGGNVGLCGSYHTYEVGKACNNNPTCDYKVDHRIIGDPCPGLKKDFVVWYSCSSDRQGIRASLLAEASGKTLSLSCGIKIISARYGQNCGPPKYITGTLAALCTGKQSCVYHVDHRDIGDPHPGCRKEFKVLYSCDSGVTTLTKIVPAEASGKVIILICVDGRAGSKHNVQELSTGQEMEDTTDYGGVDIEWDITADHRGGGGATKQFMGQRDVFSFAGVLVVVVGMVVIVVGTVMFRRTKSKNPSRKTEIVSHWEPEGGGAFTQLRDVGGQQ